MPRKPTQPPDEPARAKGTRPLTIALLLAAVVVGGVTIYVAFGPADRTTTAPPPSPPPAQADQTRRTIETLLARADAIAPGAGAAALASKREAYETACRLAQRFIQLEDPKDVVVRVALAKAQLRLGRAGDAERTVDELLGLSPKSAEGLWMKGQLVRARGGEGYLAFFRRAAESDEADAEVWSRYGMELLSRGRGEEAETYLTRAERAGRTDRQTRLGLAMLALRANRFDRAVALLTDLAGRPGASTQLLAMLAEAQKNAGQLAAAEKTLRRALAAGGDRPPALEMELGSVLLLQHRWKEAGDVFARAAERPRQAALAAFKAARCYYIAEKHALAMKYIDLASAGRADDAEVARWVRKIEDARFGRATATSGPAIRLPPLAALPPPPAADANEPPAASQPARLLP